MNEVYLLISGAVFIENILRNQLYQNKMNCVKTIDPKGLIPRSEFLEDKHCLYYLLQPSGPPGSYLCTCVDSGLLVIPLCFLKPSPNALAPRDAASEIMTIFLASLSMFLASTLLRPFYFSSGW